MTQTTDFAPERSKMNGSDPEPIFLPVEAPKVPGTNVTRQEFDTYETVKSIKETETGVRIYDSWYHRQMRNCDRLIIAPRMNRFKRPEELLNLIDTHMKPEGTVLFVDGQDHEEVSAAEVRSYISPDALGKILAVADDRHCSDLDGGVIPAVLGKLEQGRTIRKILETRQRLRLSSDTLIAT